MRSISARLATPIETAWAVACTCAATRTRAISVSRFESRRPSMRSPSQRITAAATTGPASGPMPTSSTPAARSAPGGRSSRSQDQSASRRRSSASPRARRRRSNCASSRAPLRGSRRKTAIPASSSSTPPGAKRCLSSASDMPRSRARSSPRLAGALADSPVATPAQFPRILPRGERYRRWRTRRSCLTIAVLYGKPKAWPRIPKRGTTTDCT